MDHRGMTLVEILVVVLTLSLVGGMFIAVANSSQQMWNRSDKQFSGLSTTQRGLDRLGEDLRKASLGSLQCTCPAGAICPPTEPTLSIGILQMTTANLPTTTTVVYQREGTTLTRQVGGAGATVVIGELSTYRSTNDTPVSWITCDPGGLVTVQLAASEDTSRGIKPYKVQSRAWVRNQ